MDYPVVILCGGLGTRLKEETEFKPKPMVFVGNRPILWHIMSIYAYYGFKNFILCLGYKGEMIRDYFYHYNINEGDILLDLKNRNTQVVSDVKDHSHADWKIIFADTGEKSMTGGRLKRIAKYIDSNYFLATYGDGLASINIKQLVDFHQKSGKFATVTAVSPTSRFGDLDIQNGLVTNLKEKHLSKNIINGGYFVFSKKIFDFIDGDDTVLEEKPLKLLAEQSQLAAYSHYGFWQCMDTYREVEILNNLWKEDKAPWKVW